MPKLEGEIASDLIIGGVVAGLLFGVFESFGWILGEAPTKGKGIVRKYTKKGRKEAHRRQLKELCRPELGIIEGCLEVDVE